MDRVDLKLFNLPRTRLNSGPRPEEHPIAAAALRPDTLRLSDPARASGVTLASPAPARIPPDGHLDYYARRHADFVSRHPDLPPPGYYLAYGDKYVHRFSEELAPKLSPHGQAWIAQARQNLQVAMDAQLRLDPAAFDRLEQDGEAFKDFAYGTHSRSYLEAGMSALPLADLVKIGLTPDTSDLFTRAGLEQVVEVAAGIAQERARKYARMGLTRFLPEGLALQPAN